MMQWQKVKHYMQSNFTNLIIDSCKITPMKLFLSLRTANFGAVVEISSRGHCHPDVLAGCELAKHEEKVTNLKQMYIFAEGWRTNTATIKVRYTLHATRCKTTLSLKATLSAQHWYNLNSILAWISSLRRNVGDKIAEGRSLCLLHTVKSWLKGDVSFIFFLS